MTTTTITSAWVALAASLWLAACTPQQIRPGEVHERIGDELKRAAAERARDTAAEKALLPPLAVEMPKVVEAEPRFDLSVVDAPAKQVFMAIVTGTRYNMLVPPEVDGKITVSLKDVNVLEALEAIRELYGYEFTVKGNRVTVQSNALQTRVFQVNYLASQRKGASELRVMSSSIAAGGTGGSTPATSPGAATPTPSGGGTTGASNLTSRVQTTTDSDFWGSLTTALNAIVGNAENRKVVINPQSGVIVLTASPREIRQVEAYLKATQTVVDRQVMLEAKILDVALNEQFQTGINWAFFGSGSDRHGAIGVAAPGSTLAPAGDGGNPVRLINSAVQTLPGRYGSLAAASAAKGFMGLALQTANFAALLNFLEGQGTVTVLSSPRIATLNNQKAVLKVGTDEMFVTNVTTTTTSSGSGTVSTPTLTLQPYFSGISLDVTPQIDENDNIVLHIHPAVSVVTEKTKLIDLGATLGSFSLPLASSSVNETDSIVRVRDGNIVAIGGLMAQSQIQDRNGLPGLGNAPGVGPLFGQRSSSGGKRELVFLLKPTIIADDRAWVRDLEQTGERMRALDPREFVRAER